MGGVFVQFPNAELASLEAMIEVADKSLYAAKQDGRNRFVLTQHATSGQDPVTEVIPGPRGVRFPT